MPEGGKKFLALQSRSWILSTHQVVPDSCLFYHIAVQERNFVITRTQKEKKVGLFRPRKGKQNFVLASGCISRFTTTSREIHPESRCFRFNLAEEINTKSWCDENLLLRNRNQRHTVQLTQREFSPEKENTKWEAVVWNGANSSWKTRLGDYAQKLQDTQKIEKTWTRIAPLPAGKVLRMELKLQVLKRKAAICGDGGSKALTGSCQYLSCILRISLKVWKLKRWKFLSLTRSSGWNNNPLHLTKYLLSQIVPICSNMTGNCRKIFTYEKREKAKSLKWAVISPQKAAVICTVKLSAKTSALFTRDSRFHWVSNREVQWLIKANWR